MAEKTPTPANDHSDAIATPIKEKGAKRRKLRRWINRLSWVFLILAPLVFLIAAVGYKLGLFGLGVSFGILNLKVGPLLLLLSALFGLLSLIFALVVKPRKGLVVGVLALLVPVFGLAKLKSVEKTVYVKLPFIHDVTTDTQNPPVFGEVIMAERFKVKNVNTVDYIGKKAPVYNANKEKTGDALVSALQTKAYPEIRTLILDDDIAAVFEDAKMTAVSMGWDIKEENAQDGWINATETTFWYGFKDDISIRLGEANGGGTVVDVRSVSRVGGSDMGANAKRIAEYLERLGDSR